MRFQVNLSRQPFYNRRLFWLGVIALLSMTGYFGVWTVRQIEAQTNDIRELQTKVGEQKKQLAAIKVEPFKGIKSLSEDQADQIKAAAFLIQQRSFSWTKMLEDFEA